MQGLFNKKIINQRIKNYSIENEEEKRDKVENWQVNLQNIKGLNEKRLQAAFLSAFFEDVLGYKNEPQAEEWTLEIECSVDVDAKIPDGILGFYKRVNGKEYKDHRAVIELKGPQISLDKDQKREKTTYKSPVDQAFSYTNKLDKCQWVIVSNFMEIRLYKVGRSKEYYEVFHLNELGEESEFKKFHYLFCKDNLISKTGKSQTLELSEITHKRHEDISIEFYNLYKNIRINLFEHLKENNRSIDLEILLEKAQKFLDRIIFICFCEDKGLLPNDLLHEAIKRGKESFYPSETPLWDQIKGVFRAIDEGSSKHDINAYNGGLFEYDEILDELSIKDGFFEAIYDISDYDFDSDMDVNILGHIFEQSISDIEKLKSNIKDNDYNKNESKRKKEGIYYTPQYITSYIVENAIGGYLEEVKKELGYYDLPNIEEAGSNSWETRYTNQHLVFYNKYEEKLKDIKILDPACGSGAFLNQAFDYLLEEHQWLNKQRDLLKGGQSSIFALETVQKNILKNNLFGVDLNEESVEITKLSLWLKTANKRKPLTNLDDNIKCGDSLIEDSEFAGDKAFNWEKEFFNITEKGGFDVVVGNPPYVSANNMNLSLRDYFNKVNLYFSTTKKWDLYVLFVERSLKLLRESGYFSMILPYGILNQPFAEEIRKHILKETKLLSILDLHNKKIFEDATVPTCIPVVNKIKPNDNKTEIRTLNKNKELITLHETPQDMFCQLNQYMIRTENIVKFKKITKKIEKNNKPLKHYAYVSTGAEIHGKETNEHSGHSKFDLLYRDKINSDYKPYIEGAAIPKSKTGRYCYPEIDYYLDYNPEIMRSPKFKELFESKKIIIRGSSGEFGILATLDKRKLYTSHKTTIIISKDDLPKNKKDNNVDETNMRLEYLLGILNSKLIDFYYKNQLAGFVDVYPSSLEKIPIKKDSKIYSSLVQEVSNLLKYKKQLKNYRKNDFNNIINKFSSEKGKTISDILEQRDFFNKIYSGSAYVVRNFTVNINTNIITLYSETSKDGKYELLKLEENDENRKRYLKYYLENLTEKQLEEINEKHSGNLLKRVLQIEIPDYNKNQVIKRVVSEWENLQQNIENLKEKIEKTNKKIDQIIYDLYGLTDEEIEIVKKNI